MATTIIDYLIFEERLTAAFAIAEIPEIFWPENRVGQEAKGIFNHKNWRELVGFRLNTLDCCFSHNLELFPIEAAVYYLPAFLMRATLELYSSDVQRDDQGDYPWEIAEGLFLPIENTSDIYRDIDENLTSGGPVSLFPKGRIELYHALNEEQRNCVALYLKLFWQDYRGGRESRITERGKELFHEIVNAWEKSSL